MKRDPRRTRAVIGAIAASVVAVSAAGCGSHSQTITVGAATPPALSLAEKQLNSATTAATAGPGAVDATISKNGCRFRVRFSPNRASRQNRMTLVSNCAGAPLAGATVSAYAGMLTMNMGVATYDLGEDGAGMYTASTPAWVMPGLWRLAFTVNLPDGREVRFAVDDQLGS